MSAGEFDWIATGFRPLAAAVAGARDLRDDAAVLPVTGLDHLVVSTDVLVEAVHFRSLDPAGLVGRKALRTNLSDMAAMGTCPWLYTLGLAVGAGLDAASWTREIAEGLALDQHEFGIGLAGGDTVRSAGPSMLSITILGRPGPDGVLGRADARPGDDIWVSGSIGDAALGLRVLEGTLDTARATTALVDRYLLPQPRIALGLALPGLAHAAIDLSDGLLQDLGHVCRESGTAARIRLDTVPLSAPAAALVADRAVDVPELLAGGDDYELLFTAPVAARAGIEAAGRGSGTTVTRIGDMADGDGVTVLDHRGNEVHLETAGYRHG